MKKILIYIFALAIGQTVMAQDMTFNHDESVMNQFLVGETGTGSLKPEWYYSVSHSNYKKDAAAKNKATLRGKIQLSLVQEKPDAEKLDSALTERLKREMENIADRTPGVADIGWMTEGKKITAKKEALRKNIDRIILVGGTAKEKEYYDMLYNCMECAIDNIRDNYMPSAQRKEEFLNIYKDLTNINHRVVTLLTAYLAIEGGKKYSSPNTIQQPDIKNIATSAHGRWKAKVIEVVHQ